MTKSEYYQNVSDIARKYGYSTAQITMFSLDIMDCYDNGFSVEKCIEVVF